MVIAVNVGRHIVPHSMACGRMLYFIDGDDFEISDHLFDKNGQLSLSLWNLLEETFSGFPFLLQIRSIEYT